MKKLSIEEQRELLTRRKEEYKNSLTASLKETKTEISNTLQTLALATGAILVGYLVVKFFDKGAAKKQPSPTSDRPGGECSAPVQTAPPAETGFSLTSFLKEQLAFFLVSIAKEKLHELFDFVLRQLRSDKPVSSQETDAPKNE